MKKLNIEYIKKFLNKDKTVLGYTLAGALSIPIAWTIVFGAWAGVGIAIIVAGLGICLTIIGILLGVVLIGIGAAVFSYACIIWFYGILWTVIVGTIGGLIWGLILKARNKEVKAGLV